MINIFKQICSRLVAGFFAGFFAIAMAIAEEAVQGISHIEYFAGNYSHEVLRNPKDQFGVLFETADRLAEKFGPSGVIYINDLQPLAAERTARALRDYLKSKGLSKIKVVEVPGNILEITPPKTKTAHLKNPEPFFLKELDNSANSEMRLKFSKVIERSESGITLHTFDLGLRPQDLANYLEGLNDRFGLRAVDRLNYMYFEPRLGDGKYICGPVGGMSEFHFPTEAQKKLGHCVRDQIQSLFRNFSTR